MKRTNLVLDRDQVLRIEKIRGLASFYGQGLWSGDLSKMREDRPARRASKRKKGKAR
jgi:hypothetical protein